MGLGEVGLDKMGEKTKFNRRDFLKIVGAGAGVAASGCAPDLPEKFIPYVIPPEEIIPGVASWYSGSCGECSSGCGVLVRVREGRAVKVEGNPNHPVNQGGLCAHGQSALQGLYDPDRVREPLKRDSGGAFATATWKVALGAAAQAIADAQSNGKEIILVTKPTSGSEAQLIKEFTQKIKLASHIEYELSGRETLDLGAAKAFGAGIQGNFRFDRADAIVGVGADYLETWISPVEFSRGWGKGRTPGKSGNVSISKVYHIEPRLSLTAGNADRWLMNKPGSEKAILRALLKAVVDLRGGSNVRPDALSAGKSATRGGDPIAELSGSGITKEHIAEMAATLVKAKSPLVVAGGASIVGSDAVDCAYLAFLINGVLGAVGPDRTVVLNKTGNASAKVEESQQAKLFKLFDDLVKKQRKVGVVIFAGVNPLYTLPVGAQAKSALAQVTTVVSVGTHLDETTSFANVVLPMSTQFEVWGDSIPAPGVYNLNQPAMQPLYSTQSFGDTLIALLASKEVKLPLEGITSFYDYIRAQWKARTGESGFESRWLSYVENGGDWSEPAKPLGQDQFSLQSAQLQEVKAAPKLSAGTFSLLAFPTVNSFDGSSSNRPWMQELPNPMTTTVWGSWVEMNPESAAELGVADRDNLQISTDQGAVDVPVYLNRYIHPSLIAIPIGQGHESFGRFASGVGVNVLSLLPRAGSAEMQGFLAPVARVRKSATAVKETIVKLQGHDSQENRGIARTISADELQAKYSKSAHADAAAHNGNVGHNGASGHESGEGHEGGHHDPLALGPRPAPVQMYEQMHHPVAKWGMSIDLASCTGCSACVVACYAENNVPVVGKTICGEGREMSWIHIERFLDGPPEQPVVGFVPVMCQHCGNAPCEPVCPVYATHHSEDGLNSMVYNRCVGTRYCSNNCSYKVRRFNWFKYSYPEPLNWQLNPDVTVREVGVMEKCSFCIQRIREVQSNAKDQGRPVRDGEIEPACASSCPTKAITFGNLRDATSQVSIDHQDERSYKILDVELNTQPAIAYLAKVTHESQATGKQGKGQSGSGHEGAAGQGAAHGSAGHSTGGV